MIARLKPVRTSLVCGVLSGAGLAPGQKTTCGTNFAPVWVPSFFAVEFFACCAALRECHVVGPVSGMTQRAAPVCDIRC